MSAKPTLWDALPAMMRPRPRHEAQAPGLWYCWRVMNFYTGSNCPWCGAR